MHFESVIEAMCCSFGWANVRAKVCADAAADEALARALDLAHHETTAKQTLSLRISSLVADASGMLMSHF